jgi:hypothetical protein
MRLVAEAALVDGPVRRFTPSQAAAMVVAANASRGPHMAIVAKRSIAHTVTGPRWLRDVA